MMRKILTPGTYIEFDTYIDNVLCVINNFAFQVHEITNNTDDLESLRADIFHQAFRTYSMSDFWWDLYDSSIVFKTSLGDTVEMFNVNELGEFAEPKYNNKSWLSKRTWRITNQNGIFVG